MLQSHRFILLLFYLLTGSFPAFSRVDGDIRVQNLRCELLVNPRGIDVMRPRLSWEIISVRRNIVQTSYELLVASSREKLARDEGDLWHSDTVASSLSVHIPYAGSPLKSGAVCYWKVRIQTGPQQWSDWSDAALWSMGLLAPEDWKAKWIGMDRAFPWDSVTKFSRLSARYLRKEFQTDKAVRQATIHIAGLGLYELYINGDRIGSQALAPAPTDFRKSVKYNTFDVTAYVGKGDNALGVVLGNGRFFTMRQNYKPKKITTFGFPKLLLQLEIEYRDGTRQTVVSDESWKLTADGPIRSNNDYDGEEYDATKELPGWSKKGFDDKAWLKPQMVEAPGGKLSAQMNEPVDVLQKLKPVSITERAGGVFVLDMGQNFAGWVQMRVKGLRGDKVSLRFAETLQPDGSLYVANLRDAKATDSYTLRGGEAEAWHPSFVYHGFRYVEVTGFPGKPTLNDFEGQVVSDALETTGQFETSNTLLNQIYKNATWGIRSDYKGLPLDCPQRNERMPWLGDRAVGSLGESYVCDNAKLYAKWLDDIEQAQTAEGAIPDVAPAYWNYYSDNMTWPGTYILVANMLYTQFGDRQSIIRHYPSMKKWLGYMKGKYMTDGLITKDKYGDWCVPPESPKMIHSQDSNRNTDGVLIASAYYYHLLQLMQRFAKVQYLEEDAKEFEVGAEKLKEAFNHKFYNAQTYRYGNNTVTANLLPLYFGMAPERARGDVFKNITDKITIENDSHISTGVIGTQWLMRGLTDNGRADIAYKIASRNDYPGWGYMVKNGATTIWELWNGNTANPQMNSGNHIMLLGDLIAWFYEDLAGIKPAEGYPGFEHIQMKPSPVAGLDFVKASYHSAHGWIRSEWTKKGSRFHWQVVVPANTKATVYIPASSQNGVTEGGKKPSADVTFLRMEGDRAVYELGSGEYVFDSVL